MLLETAVRDVQATGVREVARATIKATPKVFDFFSNMTYTNKRIAIVRELVANAIDAHTVAGNPEPVHVYLPTIDNPTLRVKDRGIGMSHEFMMTSFMAYTDGSTKSDSNEQIGGFGIGSKAPLAETDQFMIRSVHDGQASIYTIFKDAEGIPAIGLLDSATTDEPNGVEVIVPIEPEDFDNYRSAAEQALMFFDPKPVLHGGEIREPDYVAKGRGWAIRRLAGDLRVIMGGICYPVDTFTLPYDLRANNRLVHYGVDLTLPIGSCAVALSREALSMNDSTVESIRAALEDVHDEIVASFSTMFDRYPTWWQARKALSAEIRGNSYRASIVTEHAKYRGEELTEYVRPSADVWLISKASRRQRRLGSSDFCWGQGFAPGRVSHLIIDDLPVRPSSRTIARIRHNYEEKMERDRYIVVVRKEGATVDEILETLGNPAPEDYVLTSELDPPPVERSRSSVRNVRRYRSWGGDRLVVYEATDDMPNAVCKVVMTNCHIPNHVKAAWDHKLFDPSEVVFVNRVDERKIDLPDFMEVFEQRKAEFLAEHGDELAHAQAVRYNALLKPYLDEIAAVRDALELTPAQRQRPFGRMVELYDRYCTQPLPPGCTLIEPRLPPRINPERLVESFQDRQWRAAHVLKLGGLRDETNRRLFLELV